MTRQYNEQYHCPDCKKWFTRETEFGRWIRNNRELDSAKGYCVVDQDYWIHRFKSYAGRNFQLIMLVEIKTFGIGLTEAQKDTLHCANQIMRNRRQTPTKPLQFQAGNSQVRQVRSVMAKKEINLRVYGVHVLTFSSLGPEDSEWMTWDRKAITPAVLTSILRFDLDPDTLRELDLRNHHLPKVTKQLSFLTSPLLPSPTAAAIGPGMDDSGHEAGCSRSLFREHRVEPLTLIRGGDER